jgi:hypothetical protein
MGTRAFAALVAGAKGKEYQQMHPAKMTFQVCPWCGEVWRGVASSGECATAPTNAPTPPCTSFHPPPTHPPNQPQALRVQVNREFLELKDGLAASLEVLLPDAGRVAVLSWKHSECAIVVDFQRRHEIALPDAPLSAWYATGGFRGEGRGGVSPAVGCIVEEALRPTLKEVLRACSHTQSHAHARHVRTLARTYGGAGRTLTHSHMHTTPHNLRSS